MESKEQAVSRASADMHVWHHSPAQKNTPPLRNGFDTLTDFHSRMNDNLPPSTKFQEYFS